MSHLNCGTAQRRVELVRAGPEFARASSGPRRGLARAPAIPHLKLYPLDGEVKGYSREQFLSDLCDECEKDIRGAFNRDSPDESRTDVKVRDFLDCGQAQN